MTRTFARLAAALGLALAAGGAQAQFDGLYVGAGVSAFKTTVNLPGSVTFGDEKHRFGLGLNVGYGRSFGRFNLAGELGFLNDLGKADVFGNDFSMKEAWALSLVPGYKFGEQSLLFARIGYARAKSGGNVLPPDPGQDHTGIVWGVGAKSAFSRNLSLTVEYQAYDFNGKTYPSFDPSELKPMSTGVVVGVQYAIR